MVIYDGIFSTSQTTLRFLPKKKKKKVFLMLMMYNCWPCGDFSSIKHTFYAILFRNRPLTPGIVINITNSTVLSYLNIWGILEFQNSSEISYQKVAWPAKRITMLRVFPLPSGPYTRFMLFSRARECWPISDGHAAQLWRRGCSCNFTDCSHKVGLRFLNRSFQFTQWLCNLPSLISR